MELKAIFSVGEFTDFSCQLLKFCKDILSVDEQVKSSEFCVCSQVLVFHEIIVICFHLRTFS